MGEQTRRRRIAKSIVASPAPVTQSNFHVALPSSASAPASPRDSMGRKLLFDGAKATLFDYAATPPTRRPPACLHGHGRGLSDAVAFKQRRPLALGQKEHAERGSPSLSDPTNANFSRRRCVCSRGAAACPHVTCPTKICWERGRPAPVFLYPLPAGHRQCVAHPSLPAS